MNDNPAFDKKKRLEYLKENKCQEPGCYHWQARGYIYCEGHLHGFARKMDKEDVALLKGAGL